MVKRKRAAGWKSVIIGMGVVIGALCFTIAVLSLLIQKAIVSIDAIHIGLTLCCLISGIAGAVYSGRGERGVQSLLICLIPALALLLIAMLGVKEARSIIPVVLYASGLLIPSLITEAIDGGRRRKGGRKRKRSHVKKQYG